jgi:hypothetical protein
MTNRQHNMRPRQVAPEKQLRVYHSVEDLLREETEKTPNVSQTLGNPDNLLLDEKEKLKAKKDQEEIDQRRIQELYRLKKQEVFIPVAKNTNEESKENKNVEKKVATKEKAPPITDITAELRYPQIHYKSNAYYKHIDEIVPEGEEFNFIKVNYEITQEDIAYLNEKRLNFTFSEFQRIIDTWDKTVGYNQYIDAFIVLKEKLTDTPEGASIINNHSSNDIDSIYQVSSIVLIF